MSRRGSWRLAPPPVKPPPHAPALPGMMAADPERGGDRVQISAAHEPAHLERAVAAFVTVGRALGAL